MRGVLTSFINLLILVDAEFGWVTEHAPYPADGLFCAHRGSDGICRRKQCSTVYGLWNGYVP
jgi:hypothetical protein